MRPDLSAEEELLRAALARDHDDEVAWARSRVRAWAHSVRGFGAHRPIAFEDKRGAIRAKVLPGLPRQGSIPTQVYGFDESGSIVFVETYSSDAAVLAHTAIRREQGAICGVRWELDWGDEPVAVDAFLDVEEDGRVVRSTSLSVHTDGPTDHEFVYRNGRLEEHIERRSDGFDAGGFEQRSVMLYGHDGEPDALVNEGTVVWRRRVRTKALRAAIERAEAALVRELIESLRAAVDWNEPHVVWLRHQDDGGWFDQLGYSTAVHPLAAPPAENPEAIWHFDRWLIADLDATWSSDTWDALRALDELDTPREGEARRLLRRVAGRVSTAGGLFISPPTVVVTGVVPDDPVGEVTDCLLARQRDALAAWLPPGS